jgi:3-oxoacyl-[acyl-carrier-protein] synthase III
MYPEDALGPSPRAPRCRIVGTGHYVPERVLTNADLERTLDTSDRWITDRTGIRERRIAAPSETSSDMAAAAALKAIENAGLSPRDIDMIIVATVTPDRTLPSTAVFVQQKIGARSDCPAFDVAAACAGFIYGLAIAEGFLATGRKRVLVIGVELLSRILDWTDRGTCVLFGDGAGAAVLAPGEGSTGLLSTHVHADGSHAEALTIAAGGSALPASLATVEARQHFVQMQGSEVFKHAVRSLSSASLEALSENGISAAEVSWVVPHQANLRILEAVSARVGIGMDRFVLNIAKYGNTSSASIPIALDEARRAGVIEPGHLVLMCALGGGLAWGSALVRF